MWRVVGVQVRGLGRDDEHYVETQQRYAHVDDHHTRVRAPHFPICTSKKLVHCMPDARNIIIVGV